MLEKPNLSDEELIDCVWVAYGLPITDIAFLPIGNDVDTAVYRAVADDATPYFLKLRRGARNEPSITIPRFLRDQGIAPIIAPLETRAGRLWTQVDGFTVALYPFIAGDNGFTDPLSDHQWIELGVALNGIHTANVPRALGQRVPRETYDAHWRDIVRTFQERVMSTAFADPIAATLADFVHARRDEITELVRRAEQLGDALRARSPALVLCHGDIHAGNVLIDPDGALYIVDWDTLIFAPKERDLMFIGGGIGGVWHTAREETLFYRGYGRAEIDPVALAYYRYERIIEDIAAYGEQLLLTDKGGADRANGLRQLTGQFQPGSVIEIAYRTDTARTR